MTKNITLQIWSVEGDFVNEYTYATIEEASADFDKYADMKFECYLSYGEPCEENLIRTNAIY